MPMPMPMPIAASKTLPDLEPALPARASRRVAKVAEEKLGKKTKAVQEKPKDPEGMAKSPEGKAKKPVVAAASIPIIEPGPVATAFAALKMKLPPNQENASDRKKREDMNMASMAQTVATLVKEGREGRERYVAEGWLVGYLMKTEHHFSSELKEHEVRIALQRVEATGTVNSSNIGSLRGKASELQATVSEIAKTVREVDSVGVNGNYKLTEDPAWVHVFDKMGEVIPVVSDLAMSSVRKDEMDGRMREVMGEAVRKVENGLEEKVLIQHRLLSGTNLRCGRSLQQLRVR